MRLVTRVSISMLVASAVCLGTVTAAPAANAAPSKPKISTQPKSQSVASGKRVTLKVKADGYGLTYQWFSKTPGKSKWKRVSGSAGKKATLSIKAKKRISGAKYRVQVSQYGKKTTSRTATITVHSKPSVKKSPSDISGTTGKTVSLKAKATGGGLKYQWQSKTTGSWKNVSGATKRTFTFKIKQGSVKYRLRLKNKAGVTYSKPATAYGTTAPKITKQPESIAIPIGTSTTLKASASGNDLKYQWERYSDEKWIKVAGGTSSSLRVSSTDKEQLTRYRAVVSNKAGKATSDYSVVVGESTAEKPFAADSVVVTGGDYGFIVSRTIVDQIEGIPGDAAIAEFYYCYFNEDFPGVPYSELEIEYVGTDGKYYNNNNYEFEGDIWETGIVYDGHCSSFISVAFVPTNVLYGGSWSIFDTTAVFGWMEVFVRGA